MTEKQLLRREVRSRFPGRARRDEESLRLCGHILASQAYARCGAVCGYVPMAREADVTPVLADALRTGRRLLLPRVEGEGVMTLRRVEAMEELVPGAYGIPEPAETAPVEELTEDTLVLVPLEAIDRGGMRLGKGGGYYDRLLTGAPGVKMGVALLHQWTERVPCDPWDQPLTLCADGDGIHCLCE